MKTKDIVLGILRKNANSFVSGQKIAEEVYVTRAGIWKAIKALQADGHEIEAVTNKGYRLIFNPETISSATIEKSLREQNIPVDVVYLDEVTSTNDVALKYARENHENVLVIAERQTNGRGRRGRSFYSPKQTGLYMTLVLCGESGFEKQTGVTAMAAVAVATAIDELVFAGEDTAGIKWVNDIYINDRKVCGILTEAFYSMEDESDNYLVIGFGLNVYRPNNDFPKEIEKVAGYIVEDPDKAPKRLRERFAETIIINLCEMYYGDEKSREKAYEIYKRKSVLTGHYVKINSFSGESDYKYVVGIDDEYHLIVRDEKGCEEHISSGEVSVVKY